MHFQHSGEIWRDFPELVPGVVYARSAVRGPPTAALIVAEAMHASAAADMKELSETVADELNAIWSVTPAVSVLSPSSPRCTFGT